MKTQTKMNHNNYLKKMAIQNNPRTQWTRNNIVIVIIELLVQYKDNRFLRKMERKTYQNKAKPYKMVPSKRINQKQRKKNDFDYIFLMIIFYNHIYFIICNNYFIISSPLAPIFISIISSWSYIIILKLLLSILVLDFISLLFRQFHPNHLFLAFPSL